jgi:hypothetical protein
MLTGAARAARTCGGLRLERVWVVAVPVVFLLVFGRVVSSFFMIWGASPYGWEPAAVAVARGGPISLRSALIASFFAAAGYAFVWFLFAAREYLREVASLGRRVVLYRGVAGWLVIFGSMFLMLFWSALEVNSLPTAEDVVARGGASMASGVGSPFLSAVLADVPGIRGLCEKKLGSGSRGQQILAAKALMCLGVDSDRARAVLRSITREEFFDRRNWRLFHQVEFLSRPGGMGIHLSSLMEQTEEGWQQFRRRCIP